MVNYHLTIHQSNNQKMADTNITIYTDGAARGNPGPGGYGVILMSGNHRKELSRFHNEPPVFYAHLAIPSWAPSDFSFAVRVAMRKSVLLPRYSLNGSESISFAPHRKAQSSKHRRLKWRSPLKGRFRWLVCVTEAINTRAPAPDTQCPFHF